MKVNLNRNLRNIQNLIRPTYISDTINPVITVEVCGETKYTSAKDKVPTVRPGEEAGGAPVNWKEHLFFEPRGRVSNFSISADYSSLAP